MIGIDTNILARFYCEDPDDPEAARQRPKARKLILESNALVCATLGGSRIRMGDTWVLSCASGSVPNGDRTPAGHAPRDR